MSKLAVVLSALLLAGCATVKNTAQQDYVWTMIRACRLSLPAQCEVTKVDANGRWHGTCVTISSGWGQFNDCARDWQLAHPYRESVQRTTKSAPGEQAQPAPPPVAIALDTTDPKYQDYFNQVRERIKAKWV